MTPVVNGDGGAVGPGRWHRRRWGPTWLVGVVYFAAVFSAIDADGGRVAAWIFGTVGSAVTFPLLILLGRLLAAGLGRLVAPGDRARRGIVVLPAFVVAVLIAADGYRLRDPAEKFRRQVVSPVPASVVVHAAWTRQGMNWRAWAFHFTIAPGDVPKVLARYPFRHETERDGVDPNSIRAVPVGDPEYPIPPPDFRAVHIYSHHGPTSRAGRDVTLYGNREQTEFYLYGFVE